ncbi:sugar-binding transcriptional regulator [Rathayibacter soli]|uniref:sugar-binding transcriptional regulator n=1 Tax=Rathayibacter soli TaxID=3144168 RepID=UPI0027E498DD|nr:sugar-binding transcriptional regulator [Glaciibacter superstes]
MAHNGYVPPVDGQVRLLTKVARMYHEHGIRQADIAATLNISQAKVSRLLKRATDVGIVRTTIMVAPGMHTELEDALQQRFGLLDAVVVDISRDDDETSVVNSIGAAAASYLEATLSGSERVGVSSWSQTLLATVERMRPFSARGASEVVQLLGGIGLPDAQHQAQRLTGDLARVLGADAIYVQAPGVVANRTIRDSLLNNAALAEVTRRWNALTMAIVGVGSVEPSQLLTVSGNAFVPEDQERLLAAGAVGDICHHVFTVDGEDVTGELGERTIAIPVDSYRAIPRRIGIAGGKRKHEPVLGALMGSWINVLITDVRTAEGLVDEGLVDDGRAGDERVPAVTAAGGTLQARADA